MDNNYIKAESIINNASYFLYTGMRARKRITE